MRVSLFLSLISLILVACEDDICDSIVSYDSGWRQYDVYLSVRCGIFQFDGAKENSPQIKINKILMSEFHKDEAHILKTLSEAMATGLSSYRGELRAESDVYISTPSYFSVKNKIYYYNNGAHGEIYEKGYNFKISADGSVNIVQLSELFEKDKDWLTPVLLKSVKKLAEKYGTNAFWKSDNIESEIATNPDKAEYIHSFVYTQRDTLILIFNPLSLMPNVSGMPTIEISVKDLPFFKGL